MSKLAVLGKELSLFLNAVSFKNSDNKGNKPSEVTAEVP